MPLKLTINRQEQSENHGLLAFARLGGTDGAQEAVIGLFADMETLGTGDDLF